MRKTLIFISVVFAVSTIASGQNLTSALKEYQSVSNKYYWKNRKPFADYWQQDVHYKIDAVVDDQEESVSGNLEVTYWNNSPDNLNRIYFHLYQNAFVPGSYLADMRKNDKVKSTYGDSESKGLGTTISSLSVNGNVSTYIMDNSIMWVDLSQPLKSGTGITISIEFKTYWDKEDKGNIRRRMKTFRHGKDKYNQDFVHFDGVHWYPRISVYDRKFGWTTDQHLMKEFYGDYGIYEVSLTFPNQYIVEATGELQNAKEVYPGDLRQRIDISNYKTERDVYTNPVPPNGTTKTWKFRAINVHDFAFTADPTYRIGEYKADNGAICLALAQEEHAHLWGPTAKFVAEVVNVYSREIGDYAYPKMIAADAADGMEYPMLTLDGGNWPGHKYVIAHEVGHNWFFGMVGNNETYRASLDEGFTQFLTALSLKRINNVTTYPNNTDDGTVYYGYMAHAMGDNTARLNIHSDHFNSAERHGGGYGQVYYKTATMLNNLEYVLGEELFASAIKNYFDQWKFCHPYWEDFRSSIIRFTKVDLNWFFDEWIENTSVIDYKLAGIKSLGDDNYRIKIKRLGAQMPVDLTVVSRDGKRHEFYIPNTYFQKKTSATILPTWLGFDLVQPEYEAVIHVENGIRDVVIDSSGRLADVNRLNNSKKFPVDIRFEKTGYKYSSFRRYSAYYRPAIWYNKTDFAKVGVKLNGNFFNLRHIWDLGVWYNTINSVDPFDVQPYNPDLWSYAFSYKTQAGQHNELRLKSRFIDGFTYEEIGWMRELGKVNIHFGVSGNQRRRNEYLIYRQFGNAIDKWETGIRAGLDIPFRTMEGGGVWKINTYSTSVNSYYSYARASVELLFNRNFGKLSLRSRWYSRYMDGKSIAPESMLLMCGGNVSEMMESRFTRSRGIFGADFNGFDRSGNNFQAGGGLNLRGYAGVATTNIQNGDTFNIFAGTRGSSVSLELDIRRLFVFKSSLIRKIKNNFQLHPYLFTDAGVLGNSANQWSGLRVDAGLGTMVVLRLPKLTPEALNLRFDMPFFLNRIPAEENQYLKFRYVVGINRSF
ncbi:MAG: hypothetical protein GC181_03360 [Bacteroidetes bacterium]|nr:hypothetical protein [Bacteroidota bacterium]